MQGHMAIIASRSRVLKDLFLDKLKEPRDPHAKVIIDFGQQVHYQAFRKIVDFCYLGN